MSFQENFLSKVITAVNSGLSLFSDVKADSLSEGGGISVFSAGGGERTDFIDGDYRTELLLVFRIKAEDGKTALGVASELVRFFTNRPSFSGSGFETIHSGVKKQPSFVEKRNGFFIFETTVFVRVYVYGGAL